MAFSLKSFLHVHMCITKNLSVEQLNERKEHYMELCVLIFKSIPSKVRVKLKLTQSTLRSQNYFFPTLKHLTIKVPHFSAGSHHPLSTQLKLKARLIKYLLTTVTTVQVNTSHRWVTTKQALPRQVDLLDCDTHLLKYT